METLEQDFTTIYNELNCIACGSRREGIEYLCYKCCELWHNYQPMDVFYWAACCIRAMGLDKTEKTHRVCLVIAFDICAEINS